MTGRQKLRGHPGPGGGADSTPDQFTFTDLGNQTESVFVVGAPVTITGINVSTAFTVTNGHVQVNGAGAFVTSGTVVNGNTLTPRGTSNAAFLGTTDVIVNVGGITDTFTITTRADPGVPASVGSPSNGTPLTTTWANRNLVAPRTAPSNGTWAGTLVGDTYLINSGFVIGNDNGALWLDIGAGTKTITNYNFKNCPRIQVSGTGTVNFVDCTFDNVANPQAGFRAPMNINGSPTGDLITVNFTYCDWNITTSYSDSGTWIWDHCRFRNQIQFIWGSAGAEMLCVDCYVTGGGANPPPGPNTHVELIQYNASAASGLKFKWLRVMCNFIDGQATLSPWGSGWTAVFTSPNGGMIQLVDSIIIGVIAMDANPQFPTGMVAFIVTHNLGNCVITNCILDIAQYGYSSGPAGYPLTQSGNRTYNNVALAQGNFG